MRNNICGIDFYELEPQKYWAPPASYTEEKKKFVVKERIMSSDWTGAEKKDGYFCKIVKDEDGNLLLYGRSKNVNGEYPEKHEWVPHLNSFFSRLPNGTCLLGELYLKSKPGSRNVTTILGCLLDKALSRQKSGEKLTLYVFDVLAFDGKSYLDSRATERFGLLTELSKTYTNYENLEWGKYLEGAALWNELQTILANGGEGIVLTRKESKYQPGKRPSKDCMKVKKEIKETIDCFFTGQSSAPTREYTGKDLQEWKFYVNTLTNERLPIEESSGYYMRYMNGEPIEPVTKPFYYGWAGSLEIAAVKHGKIVPIGWLSGLPDEIKSNPLSYKGRCIEVSAMEIAQDTKGLRHAKMIGFRDDKNWKECKWEDIFG